MDFKNFVKRVQKIQMHLKPLDMYLISHAKIVITTNMLMYLTCINPFYYRLHKRQITLKGNSLLKKNKII